MDDRSTGTSVMRMNFLVGGIARSGTSSFASVLNLHPQVFCGMETFGIGDDRLEDKVFPQDFLDPSHIRYQENRDISVKKRLSRLVAIGDKQPESFLKIGLCSAMTFLFIQRTFREYVPSWNRRAEDGRSWRKGRVGAFGLFDFLLSAIMFAKFQPSNLTFVIYHELFFGNHKAELDRCFAALKVDPEQFDHQTFAARFYACAHIRSKPRELSDQELEFAEFARVEFMEKQLFEAPTAQDKLHIYGAYSKWIATNFESLNQRFIEVLKRYDNPDCLPYYSEYRSIVDAKFALVAKRSRQAP